MAWGYNPLTLSCTPLPCLADGTPLYLSGSDKSATAWKDRPHAWPVLWKHHGAQAQAGIVTNPFLDDNNDVLPDTINN